MTSIFQDYSQNIRKLHTEIKTKLVEIDQTVYHDKFIQDRFVWYPEICEKLQESLRALNKAVEFYEIAKKRSEENIPEGYLGRI